MSYQWGLRPTGLETHASGATIPYRLVGEWTEATARSYIFAAVPVGFGAFVIKDVRITYIGAGTWDVDAEYGSPSTVPQQQNQVRWTFDTTGQTKRITQGVYHAGTYVPSGYTAIEHGGAIGVTDDSVEGVDVPDKAFRWSETWSLPVGSYGFIYATVLGELTGRVNASYFRGFPAHTVRFDGSVGGSLVGESLTLREYTFNFAVSPSENGITIGNISGISKAGWEYLWVRYEAADDSAANKTTPKPIQVEVDGVLLAFNFSLLGIGTNILT